MGKIKINLSSGNVIEKPLVTCFQGTNGTYLILDNEANGSMGLPIICISKFNGSAAEKIVDQNEWAAVKENLKSIISGTNVNYISVPDTISAQDDFYTQLTLPVASFDLLKNKYGTQSIGIAQEQPTQPIQQAQPMQQPVQPVQPMMPDVQSGQPVSMNPEMPAVPEMPMADGTVNMNQTPEVPMPPINTIEPNAVEQNMPMMPPMPDAVPNNDPVIDMNIPSQDMGPVPINPVVNSEPASIEAPASSPEAVNNSIISPAGPINPTPDSNSDMALVKDNFLKSCESMFDSLVDKMKNNN